MTHPEAIPAQRFCQNCGAPLGVSSRFCGQCAAPTGLAPAGAASTGAAPATKYGAVEAFISIAVGLFLLLMGPRMAQWVSSRIFGTHFNEFYRGDVLVPYPQTEAFWMDLGPTLFAALLILCGICLFLTRARAVVWVMLALTAGVTLYNLGYLVTSFGSKGFAPLSMLAGIAGVLMLVHQRTMLRSR
jgi:hypothetical protein